MPGVRNPILIAAHHLLHVWAAYGATYRDETGALCLEHRNMTAGEDASDFLETLGLGEDVGYAFRVNDAGRALMDAEIGGG